jgi:hypothetical protein
MVKSKLNMEMTIDAFSRSCKGGASREQGWCEQEAGAPQSGDATARERHPLTTGRLRCEANQKESAPRSGDVTEGNPCGATASESPPADDGATVAQG